MKGITVVVTGAGGYLGKEFISQAPNNWDIIPLFHGRDGLKQAYGGYYLDIAMADDVRNLSCTANNLKSM